MYIYICVCVCLEEVSKNIKVRFQPWCSVVFFRKLR